MSDKEPFKPKGTVVISPEEMKELVKQGDEMSRDIQKRAQAMTRISDPRMQIRHLQREVDSLQKHVLDLESRLNTTINWLSDQPWKLEE